MPKFNVKKGIAGVKREAKKMPKRTAKQIPNAALVVTGGVGGAAVRAAGAAAKRVAAKKAAAKAAKRGYTTFKIPGQKRPVKLRR